MEGHNLYIVYLTFTMLLLIKKKMLLKLLCYYYFLGQNKLIYFLWMADDHWIIMHLDKIVTHTNSVSAPRQMIFAILFDYVFAISD